ncbi:MAG: type II toxin-antitoxin system RelE/ParE family toxin [Candidatus Cloacimonetes bacterium]|nr:type II toxin-antitoxin system RelE/ParE family toxin [Candidatus Cloacimonadota bacterium]
MAYKINYKSSVFKDLKRLDKPVVENILNKIESDLVNNPRKDKELSGKYKGLYTYRIGNYKIIYTLLENIEAILILRIGHRKDV